MKLGFTGTEHGMSAQQRRKLRTFLRAVGHPSEIHLGDCIGADEEARQDAEAIGVETIGHPPEQHAKRAFGRFDITLQPKGYLERDRDIVDACEHLIAAPDNLIHDKCRHGVCYTVRYALKEHKPVTILERI